MSRAARRLALALTLLGANLAAGATGNPYYAHSHALVIGIDRYPTPRWPALAYARRDAEAVAAWLREHGFEVTTLLDEQATKTAIVSAMQTRLAPSLGKDDRVLVFFAGHGHTEHLADQDFGYLVPYDATADSATYLSMEELRTLSRKMGQAKHQLFILNACYGGLLGLRGVARVAPDTPRYLDRITTRPARQFITAGGRDQQVLDGGPGGLSFFTYYLIEALDQARADLDGDRAITFHELTGYLIPRASNEYQTPTAGSLPGDGGGELVFLPDPAALRLATPPPAGEAPAPLAPATPATRAGDADASAPSFVASGAGRWLVEHLGQVFSGIGTAIAVALFGWLAARYRRRSTREADTPAPVISQSVVGNHNAQAAGEGASATVNDNRGSREVHIGGSATGNVIVTGDDNRVK